MLKALLSRVSFLRRRTLTLSRNDQLQTDSAERRERWNQVIAEHQKPLDKDAAASAKAQTSAPPPN